MNKKKGSLEIVLYVFLFVVIVPLGLCFWAFYTEGLVSYPVIQSDPAGWIFIIAGGTLLMWGMFAVWKYGQGLPINYSPPKKLVTQGPFRLVRNPIYWGFGILMAGVFIIMRSASGLWLVTPINILGMAALVLGYEKIDLKRRFPGQKQESFFDFPGNNANNPTIGARISTLLRIIGLLVIANFLIYYLPEKQPAPFELPVNIPAFFENYSFTLINAIFILFIPFLLQQNKCLRDWNYMAIISISTGLFIALLYPSAGGQYLPGENVDEFAEMESLISVVTVPVFLTLVSLKSVYRYSRIRFIVYTLILLVPLATQFAISRSPVISILTTVFIYILAAYYRGLWLYSKNISEKIANSWREWKVGKVRIINHGIYVGFAAFAGLLAGGILVGEAYTWAILVFSIVVIIIAALWAQIIEGSEKLKRPFGYYGGLAGMLFGSAVVWLMGYNVWTIVGVCTIFLPWAQAIGRLRCLVNGCCHGSPVENPEIGIRYYHYRSRVCGISGLKGEYLHPTQLYSIIWLFIIGFIFFALWHNGASPSFLLGLYLLLTGIGRFVEEAYRGEVQTPIVKNLRLYQWTAIVTVVLGIAFTLVPSQLIVVNGGFSWEILLAAFIGGFCTFFAMGVDFPDSNARFSRLV